MALAAVEGLLVGGVRLKPIRDAARGTSWAQRLIILYMLLTWLSALCSDYFPQTVIGVSRYEGALTITIYCLCFLLVSAFGVVTRRMLYCMAAAATAFGALCILQLAGLNPFTLYPEGYNYFGAYTDYSGAYLGTIGNVDLVAAFLCIVIPLLWIALLRLRGKARLLLIVPLGICLYVLVRMYVLAGLVGVAVGGVISLPVVLPISAKRRKILACGIAGAALLAVIVLFAADIGGGMLHEVHEILHGNIGEDFGSGRIHIWSQVLSQIPSHPLLGAGPDTMTNANLEAFSRYDKTYGFMIVSQIDVAHNEYLNILYHQGIFSLLVYLAFLVLLAKKWLSRSAENPAVAMLGGAAACYCIQAFFGFSMCITAPFFWTTAALLEGQGRKIKGGKNPCGKKS
jgi:O-antigen ligase